MAGDNIRRVAVIGTGTIGASWAALFLARGLTVAASDPVSTPERICIGGPE
jgi:carnitine 3-dehydrogenase